MNNKGFTMVELLGVVVIMGILMSVAVAGVSIYRDKAAQQAYDTLAQSASGATANYIMDYPDNEGAILIKELHESNYLEKPSDPNNEGNDCNGVVVYNKNSGSGNKLDTYDYKVHLCCSNYQKTYLYPSGNTEDIPGGNYCKNLNNVDMETGELNAAPTCSIEIKGETNVEGDYKSAVEVKLKTRGTITDKGLTTSSSKTYNSVTNVIHTGDGNVTYYGYVKNSKGEGSCTKTFKKNGAGPEVTVINDSGGNWVNRNVRIDVNSNDPKGIKKVEYSYDNKTWYSDCRDPNADLTHVGCVWEAERDMPVYIKVTSNTGNYTIEETRVRIDRTPPVVTDLEVHCGIKANYDRYLFFRYTDYGSGLGRRELSWTFYDKNGNNLGSNSSTANWNVSVEDDRLWDNYPSLKGEASISYNLSICDHAGNCTPKSGSKVPFSPPIC